MREEVSGRVECQARSLLRRKLMYESTSWEVQDLMTRKVAVLHEEENLELAEWGMKTFRFRHLPVVDGDKLVGLVSERDLLRASISSLDEAHDLRDDNLKRYFFVREIMTTEVVSVRPETSLIEAAAIMSINKLDCLPVTRADGMLVGILTASDFLGVAIDLLRRTAPKLAQRAEAGQRESAQTR